MENPKRIVLWEDTVRQIIADRKDSKAFRVLKNARFSALRIISGVASEIWDPCPYRIVSSVTKAKYSLMSYVSRWYIKASPAAIHQLAVDEDTLRSLGFDLENSSRIYVEVHQDRNPMIMKLEISDYPNLVYTDMHTRIMSEEDISGGIWRGGGKDMWTILELLARDMKCDFILGTLLADEDIDQARLVKAKERRGFLVYWEQGNRAVKIISPGWETKFNLLKKGEDTMRTVYQETLKQEGYDWETEKKNELARREKNSEK